MSKHQRNKLIKHFRQLADQAGKPLAVIAKRSGIRVSYAGRGVTLPQRVSGPIAVRNLEKRLGFGS